MANIMQGAQQLIRLLAPHLLRDRGEAEEDKWPVQTIDPSVFKMRTRNRKSPEKNKYSQ